MNHLSPYEQSKIICELNKWANTESRARPANRPLSVKEIITLKSGGLIEIGSHSETHNPLTNLCFTLIQKEIRKSKNWTPKHINIILLDNILNKKMKY